ncbi:alpha/beta hydrolase [Saccharomonospora sp. NPDC046836]|uniref:alpha/beta fold hydrolase n=1 Tax=Saccharomonospora sp. NPDC046836 TaxID=3156921 RepID=UPI0033E895D5
MAFSSRSTSQRPNRTIYRSEAGRNAIATWCTAQLGAWPVPHERQVVTAAGAPTHLVTAGSGDHTVLVLPGTTFCAAAYLPLGTALAARTRVVLPDLPGQPGLSGAARVPSADKLGWYGRWLAQLVDQVTDGPVTILGHSLGGAIALSCDAPRVHRQVLVSPAGLTRLRLPPRVIIAFTDWILRRQPAASAHLLRLLHGAGHAPRPELVEWMTLVARHVRSTRDPGHAAVAAQDIERTVVVGADDVFLPAHALAPVVLRTLCVPLDVMASAGHLIVDEFPDRLAELASGHGKQ